MLEVYAVSQSHSKSHIIDLHPVQAGAIAAFTVDLLVYPLDTIKTRYQSQDYIKTYAASSTKKPPVFRGLYQGVGSVILATLPAGMPYAQVHDVLMLPRGINKGSNVVQRVCSSQLTRA